MVVYGGKICAGFVGYLPERRAGKAVLSKQSLGSVKNSITSGLMFC